MKKYLILALVSVILFFVSIPLGILFVTIVALLAYRSFQNYIESTRLFHKLISSINSDLIERDQLIKSCISHINDCFYLEKSIDNYFHEHAYSPFWDRVKQYFDVMNDLKALLLRIDDIDQRISKHRTKLPNIEDVGVLDREFFWPIFKRLIGFTDSKHAREVAIEYSGGYQSNEALLESLSELGKSFEKIESLVREAQRDFSFSSIYEQKRTNSLLENGFANINEALHELSLGLISALSKLVYSHPDEESSPPIFEHGVKKFHVTVNS